MIDVAIAKFHPVIFARRHPIYQKLIYSYARDQLVMPTEVKEILKKYVSGSKYKRLGKCQGGDAALEELNKESKAWFKTQGIPSNEQWKDVITGLPLRN